MKSATVLNTEISVTSVDEVSELLNSEKRLSVAVCNVNTVVTCYRNKSINKIINSFDIKCPDGFPIAKSSEILHKNKQKRVDGYYLLYETNEFSLIPWIIIYPMYY